MADLDFTTRGMYQGYIERTIRPALGDYEVGFLEQHPELLDRLYAKLRHRRRLCGGRVLAAAEEHGWAMAAIVWLALVTGARRGELCALRWPNINEDEGDQDQPQAPGCSQPAGSGPGVRPQ
jgi:integrase